MAERDLTAPMLAALQAGHVQPAFIYEGEFADSNEDTVYLRLWTGVGDLSWGGKTWRGDGQSIEFSPIGETGSLQAIGFDVKISGQPQANVALGLTAVRRNRPGRIWLALFDAAGAIIVDPYLLTRGMFDKVPIDDSGATCTVTLRYEDRLLDGQTVKEMRYTHESQQLRSLGDRGFEYVEALQDASFLELPPPAF